MYLFFTLLFVSLFSALLCCCENKEKEKVNTATEMNVFLCADDGNAMPTCVTIASLLSNTPKEKKLSIYLVYFSKTQMSKENKDKIISMKKIRDFDLNFVPFDEEKIKNYDNSPWSNGILVKLFACELFPNLDKILWLDDDVIVLKNLASLFDDVGNKYAACVDVSKVYEKHAPSDLGVFNSSYWVTAGVILLNLDEIRKNDLQKLFLEHCKYYTENIERFRKEDHLIGGIEEYAMTKVLSADKVLSLPQRYSIMAFLVAADTKFSEAYKEEVDNVCAIHFCSPNKPWGGRKSIPPYMYNLWVKYFLMTPYSKEITLPGGV
jgi:lipopolysaccharide biosynthesis glycosyltransferase